MIKILFVCHGNICRSPMAEYIFKDKINKLGLHDFFYTASMATSTEEIGNDIYPPAKRCLAEHNVPFSKHSARQITKKDYEEFDHIYLMDANNLRNIKRIIPDDYGLKIEMLGKHDVADPWYTGNFERTYQDLNEMIDNRIEELRSAL